MSEWNTRSLSELVSFYKGRKVETSPFQEQGYQEYLGAGALSGASDGYADTALAVMATEKDVLMLWDGERSGLCGTGLSGVVSSTVAKLSSNGIVNSRLLYYLLLKNFEWIQNHRTGTGVPHVPKDIGRILRLTYPTEERVQERIVSILKASDRAIEKTTSLIKKYQKIKSGLMCDLFTRGIGPNKKLRPSYKQAPELYQNTPVGWVPKEWSPKKLGEILLKIESGWSPDCIERPPSVGEWGVLKVSAVTRGYFDCLQSKTLPDTLYPRFALEVKAGDVIMTRANGVAELVGECVQVTDTQEKLMLSDKLLRLVPDEGVMSKEFLGMLMHSNGIKHQIRKTMNGSSGQRNISQGDIRNFVCFVPSLDEQKAIYLPVNYYQRLIDQEVKYIDNLRQQRYGLMHDLLAGESPFKLESDACPESTHV